MGNSNNNDWKEIEEYAKKEKENMINEYGIDIRSNFERKTSKESIKKRMLIKKIVILGTILLVIFFFFISWCNLSRLKYKMARIGTIEDVYNIKVEEKAVNVNLKGNGFLTYKIDGLNNLEIHALSKDDYTFINDLESRMYKYFFEKWEDENKYKFSIEENYEDYSYNLTTKKGWILNYKTYIDVNNYEEMLDATELIIKFRKYTQYPNIIMESYIRFNNQTILPHNVSSQTDDEIRESAKEQYLKIVH